MKTEYFNNEEFNEENLMEPWKETFTRQEVEELRRQAFFAGTNYKERYVQRFDSVEYPDFNKFLYENPLQ